MTGDGRQVRAPRWFLEDVIAEHGNDWDIAPVKDGFSAVRRDSQGTGDDWRYGRTPAELKKSIEFNAD